MPQVSQILSYKGSQVFTINPRASVHEAALLMNEHKIGALVVLDAGEVAGIITERDVLRRVVGEQRDPQQTSVGDVMSSHVVYCTPDMRIDEARGIFMQQRIRHLPVIDEVKGLVGLISIGDLNAWQLDGQRQTIHYLHEYINGRT